MSARRVVVAKEDIPSRVALSERGSGRHYVAYNVTKTSENTGVWQKITQGDRGIAERATYARAQVNAKVYSGVKYPAPTKSVVVH
jgi:hypothetical protein